MVFIAGDQSAEVLQPGEQAFDSPSLAVAPELAAILRFLPTAAGSRLAAPIPEQRVAGAERAEVEWRRCTHL